MQHLHVQGRAIRDLELTPAGKGKAFCHGGRQPRKAKFTELLIAHVRKVRSLDHLEQPCAHHRIGIDDCDDGGRGTRARRPQQRERTDCKPATQPRKYALSAVRVILA